MNSHGKGVSSGVLQANARLRDALMILEGLEMPSNEKELKHRKPQERASTKLLLKPCLAVVVSHTNKNTSLGTSERIWCLTR